MKMLAPTLVGFTMYASMLILLCIGFTFTHMLEKFPNFAHTSYASIGTVLAYTFVRLWGFNPYLAWPFAALLNGFVGIALYLLMVQPMRKAGTSNIHITFAMFALTYLINTLILVYSYWIMLNMRFRASGFVLKGYDFYFMGLPGIFYVAPVTCVTLVTTLHLFLTRTKFGIAIRATTEDPKLASSLGVNVFHTHLASWFLTGAMAGLAGAALPLWYATSMGGSDELMVNVMAGSILGGLENVYGAILGGVFLAFTQMIMPGMLITTLGLWVSGYVPLIPIIVIVVVLMLMPNGIAGALTSNSRQAQWLRYRISRLLRGINSPQRPV